MKIVQSLLSHNFKTTWLECPWQNNLDILACYNGPIYTTDELSDAEFILEDDLPISDDLASRDR